MTELRPIDQAFARMLTRRAGLSPDAALERTLGLPNLALSEGDLCARLDKQQQAQVHAVPSIVRSAASNETTPLVLDGDLLYLDRTWRDETLIVDALRARAAAPSSISPSAAAALVAQVFSDHPDEEDQRQAVALALTRRFALITGGPGTGKTTVVRRLLLCLEKAGGAPRVALAAPTGKATDRLREQVGDVGLPMEKSTLHSLLAVKNLDSESYRRGPLDPICADVVIVDEASMVDARQMARLLGALRPETSLVLLGDADQLQAVASGAVLADICRSTGPVKACIARLEHNWRAEGKGILDLAAAIRKEDPDACAQVLASATDVELVTGGLETELKPRVLQTWTDLATLPAAQALQQFRTLRVLCAHRHGPKGVSGVNRMVEGWLARGGHIKAGREWYEGRPVMVRRNDYGLDLRNGNTALIRQSEAVFDLDGYPTFPPSLLPQHETCYATTVHKAQGSEGQQVVVVLPDQASPLLTKELLYTAVTRASKRVTLIGSQEVLAMAVTNPTHRVSGLTERLSRP